MKKILMCVLIVFTFKSVSGQTTIIGTILDQNKRGVCFATIKLFKDTNLIAQTYSHIDGWFQFKNIGSGTFKIISECLNYKSDTMQIKLANEREFHIKLRVIDYWEELFNPKKANSNRKTK